MSEIWQSVPDEYKPPQPINRQLASAGVADKSTQELGDKFERFDEYNSGIANLPDGRCVVEVGEYPAYLRLTPGNEQRYDLSLAIHFVRLEPDIACWYGYEHTPPINGGLPRVVIPSIQQLNERKNTLPPGLGVNLGVFKSQQGAQFSAEEYLSAFAQGEIPIATEADEKAHDMCAHMGGFAIMSAEIFNFLSVAAQDALKSNDYFGREHQGRVAGMIDLLSGALTADASKIVTSYISMSYSPGISKSEMVNLVERLQASQVKTTESLRAFTRNQQ